MKKRNIYLSLALSLIAILFTILVKMVDVRDIGLNGTSIGFASINKFSFDVIGVNMKWYHITDWLGLFPVFLAIIYAFIGLFQLIRRRSLLKVDKEIIILGLFYVVVIFVYLFFENVIVNYRPVLINGILEVSYPSSHTLMSICLCGSSIMVNPVLFNGKWIKYINLLSLAVIVVTVIGRLISGVHWFTDIMGGIFISMALLMILYTVLKSR